MDAAARAARRGEPRDACERLEAAPVLPPGPGERFAGFGVLGVRFASGHWLAMRRFPASSLGEPYTSVWHRDPRGRWTFHCDVQGECACPRFFAAAGDGREEGEIGMEWTGDRSLTVTVPGAALAWAIHLAATPGTRLLNGAAGLLPAAAWAAPRSLRLPGLGEVRLTGRTPSGHLYRLSPLRAWLVEASVARLRGEHLGPPVTATEQPRLGDFRLPRWGVLALGRASFRA